MSTSNQTITNYQHVMQAFDIKGVHFSNRVFFAPMGVDLANTDGTFSAELEEFHDGIVDGGCGFVVLSNASVSKDSILQPNGLRLYEKKQADALRNFIQHSRSKGTEIGIQLQHYGGQGVTTYTKGQPLLTPSGVPSAALQRKDLRYRCRAMTLDDIKQVIDQFVYSAVLAESAEAKLIQLQASNGYLLSSFLSPATNLRTDEYGGDAVARAKFLLDVITEIRKEISPDIVLAVRLGVDDLLGEAGTVASDFEHVMPLLEKSGVDLIEVSVATADTFAKLANSDNGMGELIQQHTKQIKQYSNIPIGFAGLVKSLEQADSIIENQVADFIGMARALFADNDLIKKTIEGRREEINWCLWDGKCFKDKHNPRYDRVYCCVNPKYKRPE